MPPPGPRPWPRPPVTLSPVELTSIDADVRINDRHATTTLILALHNSALRLQEAEVMLPVPSGATLREFGIEGAEGKFSATLMPRDEARRIYDDIVRRLIDPGLLEFAGTGLVRSSVFPVPPGGTARARVVYEEFLPEDNGRIDYFLPRSEAGGSTTPWKIDLSWKCAAGGATLYCPSHPADIKTDADGSARLSLHGPVQPGALHVSALRRVGPGASALSISAYPQEAGEDGYFLMILAPPDANAPTHKREVTLVLDRSGSMAGEKIEQVRAAALQVVEGLEDGEAFNIISYNEAVSPLFDAPRVKDTVSVAAARQFIAAVRPSGGTNIHDALQRAVSQPVGEGRLPVVLFLTDGLPTVGETFEKKIRDRIAAANTGKRRIFTFGVGTDVNTPLLARLADDSRAASVFVLPKEDVEMKVVSVFRRLAGPQVAEPVLGAKNPDGSLAAGRTDEILPTPLPDLFAGDARVIVGRFRGEQPIAFNIRGRGPKGDVETRATFDPATASRGNSHIPRLWATRRIAALTDALRDMGSESGIGNSDLPRADDPRAKELVDEIVRLSLKHGILSEYTAFLARDGASFDPRPEAMRREAYDNFRRRAMQTRSGAGAVNQEANSASAKSAGAVDKGNHYLDSNLQDSSVGGVQQIADKTFFNRNGSWTDSAVAATATASDLTEIEIGTPAFDRLVDSLVASQRQSVLALPGDVIFNHEGRNYRIRR
jgi:Ca-activated chloride channel family protein